jgi:hypothetical protein
LAAMQARHWCWAVIGLARRELFLSADVKGALGVVIGPACRSVLVFLAKLGFAFGSVIRPKRPEALCVKGRQLMMHSASTYLLPESVQHTISNAVFAAW